MHSSFINMSLVAKTHNILDVYAHCKELLENPNHQVLVFLDIDDTVLSSQLGVKFVDKHVPKLVDLVYRHNPRNLFFLTARDSEYKRKTLNHLNRAKLVHTGKYVQYNVLHSPYHHPDTGGCVATKGETLVKFLTSNGAGLLAEDKVNWVVFVDDEPDQIESVHTHLTNAAHLSVQYALYHYTGAELSVSCGC